MPINIQQLAFTLLIYLFVYASTVFFIEPYSFISFIGPIAGITTALVIFWGTHILFITALTVAVFVIFLSWHFQIQANLAMVLITVLAIVLQSYWAKQLSLDKVLQQNWLKSRQALFSFLFIIGPLTSTVIASAIIVITMLDNELLGTDLLYTFFSSWASSVLFAVFFTPILLLTEKQQELVFSKRLLIIFASSLAFIALSFLFKIAQNIQLDNRYKAFSHIENEVQRSIKEEVSIITSKIDGLSALIKASDFVTISEFNTFAQNIYHENSAMRALEWAPIVKHQNRADFEKESMPIMERSQTAMLQRAGIRDVYAPIRYVYPSFGNQIILGYDVLTNSENIISMVDVTSSEDIIASAPLNLVQDNHTNPGILFVSAVYKNRDISQEFSKDNLGNEQGLLGYVVGVVQFEPFFKNIAEFIKDDINLLIEDVSSTQPYIIFGKQLNNKNRHAKQITLDINSRQWRITLAEHKPWQMQKKSWQSWSIVLGAIIAGILFQLFILIMAVYSSELSAQVIRKTRELILAKDQSERGNTAKSNFLMALNKEIKDLLQVIQDSTVQLKSTEQPQQSALYSIDMAKQNMARILDMVVDVSKMESGELLIASNSFDFHDFLGNFDEMLKSRFEQQDKKITLLIDADTPHFINSDEGRIQQLLLALCESVHELFDINNVRLTIKVYSPQHSATTLLFVFTEHNGECFESQRYSDDISVELSQYSAQLGMSRDICQLMGGDVSFDITPSGSKILTASIKVIETSIEQQESYQAQFFDQ